jgi:hypothetical protein
MTNAAPSSTVFDETTPSTHVPNSVTPDEANQDTLESLVGEGKKFKTNEDLAKAKLESDTFINRLIEEKKELQRDLEARLRTEEAIEALNQKKPNGDPKAPPAESDIKRMVENTLDEVERGKVAKANLGQANAHLIDKFGGKAEAEAFLLQKSEELGVPMDWLKDMAARSPKALYNTLGIDTPVAASPKGSVKGDVNTEAKKAITPPKANSKEAYDELRRKSPNVYWSTKVQQEIFEATKQGTYK